MRLYLDFIWHLKLDLIAEILCFCQADLDRKVEQIQLAQKGAEQKDAEVDSTKEALDRVGSKDASRKGGHSRN